MTEPAGLDPNSILDSTKKALQLQYDYDVFDMDIMMHINSVFATLNQLGIGPAEGYQIADSGDKWDAFIGTDPNLNPVKTYVFLRVRMLFDPPQNSFLVTAIKEQLQELEWRLSAYREGSIQPTVTVPDGT